MCSIFKYKNTVGRNFDYEITYKEEPRIINKKEHSNKYKIIGMCTGLIQDHPLFYDGMNEHGLVMGGLAFTGNAQYNNPQEEKYNIPSYNIILELLGNYKTVQEIKNILDNINITNEAYNKQMPPSDLHWFIADKNESIIIEQTNEGLKWYNGSVMTNNPPYNMQKALCMYNNINVGLYLPVDKKCSSRGMDTFNLVGDYTSFGRYSRLNYLKNYLSESTNDFNPVSQSFHLCSSVEQVYGLTSVGDKYEYTIYSVVYDMDNLELYLKQYDNLEIEIYDLK